MQLGRRLDLWRSPVVVAVVAIVFVALVLDSGVGWYQGHSLAARRLARLQLENMALQSLFVELKRVMKGVIDYLDHQFINDLVPFDKVNPSAENIAKFFHDRLSAGLETDNPVTIAEVKVWETDTSSAVYRP